MLRLVFVLVLLVPAVATEPASGDTAYVEPQFSQSLFPLEEIPLALEERRALANELVKAAYFFSDQPPKSAEALALADAFVPRHSGTRVANFRLRRGFGPSEIQMIVVDEIGKVLLGGASTILERSDGEEALRAAGYLVSVSKALPIEDRDLRNAREALVEAVPEVDWQPAFQPPDGNSALVGNG